MLHETVDSQRFTVGRSDRHVVAERSDRKSRRLPLRVLPLAFGAVLAVVLAAEVADAALWNISGERYAADIINSAL